MNRKEWKRLDAWIRDAAGRGEYRDVPEADREEWESVTMPASVGTHLQIAARARRALQDNRRRGEFALTGAAEGAWYSWHGAMRQARRMRGERRELERCRHCAHVATLTASGLCHECDRADLAWHEANANG